MTARTQTTRTHTVIEIAFEDLVAALFALGLAVPRNPKTVSLGRPGRIMTRFWDGAPILVEWETEEKTQL